MQQTELPSVKLLQSFCQEPQGDSCFLSDRYICYCSSQIERKSPWLSYHPRHVAWAHCYNQGFCVQGDITNQSDFVYVCPRCVSGKFCQLASSRFSISLEFLVEEIKWGSYHLLRPSLFIIIVMIFNDLCLITFLQLKTRHTATEVCLLVCSITSQYPCVVLFIRVVYYCIARQIIVNEDVNQLLCKSLPYLMISLYYVSLWLMVFVTIERALAATLPTRCSALHLPKSAAYLSLLASICIFGTNYLHINQYKLINQPNNLHSWCINEIQPSQQHTMQHLSLIHQISPFLVNVVGNLIMIVGVSRSKATSHRLSTQEVFLKQARQRIDLFLGPTICFITQLPQFIILFLDICEYD